MVKALFLAGVRWGSGGWPVFVWSPGPLHDTPPKLIESRPWKMALGRRMHYPLSYWDPRWLFRTVFQTAAWSIYPMTDPPSNWYIYLHENHTKSTFHGSVSIPSTHGSVMGFFVAKTSGPCRFSPTLTINDPSYWGPTARITKGPASPSLLPSSLKTWGGLGFLARNKKKTVVSVPKKTLGFFFGEERWGGAVIIEGCRCGRCFFLWIRCYVLKTCGFIPSDSKWPSYPLIGGHLTFERVTYCKSLNLPKKVTLNQPVHVNSCNLPPLGTIVFSTLLRSALGIPMSHCKD